MPMTIANDDVTNTNDKPVMTWQYDDNGVTA